ncbi:MAG: iron-sulfur cluster assembly scaffold protein, partial [Halobacteriota archaeon]
MYSDKVMLHFMNPHHMGEIENPSGVGVVGNPVCGDLMQIQIKVEDG